MPWRPARLLAVFFAGYWAQRPRANYAFIFGGWFAWCAGQRVPAVSPTPAVSRGTTTLAVRVTKGDQPTVVALAPPTM